MQISPHFTYEELYASQTAARRGIDNTPPPEVLSHLRMLAVMLERIRELLQVPVLVSSAYRSPALNTAIGGSPTSVHCLGLAADFIAPAFGTPYEVARRIEASPLIGDIDQLIHEHTWVHVGLARPGTMPRQTAMTLASRPGEPARYVLGIVERGA